MSHVLVSLPVSSGKSLYFTKLLSHYGVKCKFSKIGNECCHLFSLKWQACFFHLQEDFYYISKSQGTPDSISSAKEGLWKRLPVYLAPQTVAQMLFLGMAIVLQWAEEVLPVPYILSQKILKKWASKGPYLVLLILFTAFTQSICETKLSSSSLSLSALSGENTTELLWNTLNYSIRITLIVCCHYLDSGWSASSFTFLCFCTLRANVNTMTKAHTSLCYYTVVLLLKTPW